MNLDEEFANMRQALKQGVKVVAVNQLFTTPPELAARMVEMADINEDSKVLEPSAGTGIIARAIVETGAEVVAVEINSDLSIHLGTIVNHVINTDFLEYEYPCEFDAVVMNPPFENGADIKHILHARKFLKPGGRLVAICADGPRQSERLKGLADTWERLPAGTFKHAGTMVNTVLLTMAGMRKLLKPSRI